MTTTRTQPRDERGRFVRTWHNVDTNGGGGLLRNTPDGWVSGTDPGGLWWRGSDRLDQLLSESSGGYRRFTRDGIVYTVPDGGGRPSALAAVGRATSLIADTLSGLPWRLVTGDVMSDPPRWISDPQMARQDKRVSAFSGGVNPLSSVAFWSQVFISQLWGGMAYVYTPLRFPSGDIQPPIFVLNPADVTVRRYERDGKAPGVWLDDAQGGAINLGPEEVLVLPGQGPYDADGVAESILTRYARLFGLAETIQAYSVGTFTAGVPAGYLKSSNPNLQKPQADELKAQWMDAHGGPDRSIAVLNSAVEFHPIAFSPVDAALIDSAHFTIQQIALAFGLEPYMLGEDAGSSTYANIESRQQHFATFSLLPWARRVEAALGSEFAFGTDVRLDMRGLLRADTATRYSSYATALASGWLTVDEVRALEDLGPLPEAEAPAATAPPTLEAVS